MALFYSAMTLCLSCVANAHGWSLGTLYILTHEAGSMAHMYFLLFKCPRLLKIRMVQNFCVNTRYDLVSYFLSLGTADLRFSAWYDVGIGSWYPVYTGKLALMGRTFPENLFVFQCIPAWRLVCPGIGSLADSVGFCSPSTDFCYLRLVVSHLGWLRTPVGSRLCHFY